MLKQALVLIGLILPYAAQAHVEICNMEGPTTLKKSFEHKRAFDLRKEKVISPFYLSLVNEYFQREGYQARSLDQIRSELFKKSPSNDLYIISYVSKSTKASYLEVVSFPEELNIGVIYDGVTGNVLGHNVDGTISYVTADGEKSCDELEE